MKKSFAVGYVVIVFLAVLAVLGLEAFPVQRLDCSQRFVANKCLPAGQCLTPNDTLVDCRRLHEFPSHTDW